uniref:LRRCT domain-containing protein n=1 Tax=Photinus pyralis TaxID=7054 RepID=A0A1Y1KCP6_PHOPY
MYPSLLLVCVSFLTFISLSFEACRVVKGAHGLSNYMCDSIQDLNQKPILLDVVIYKDGTASRINQQTKTPKFSATLAQKAGGKFNIDVVNGIQKVSNIASSISMLTGLNKNTFDNIQLEKIQLRDGYLTSIEPGTFSKLKNVQEIQIISHALQRIQSGVFSDLPIITLALSNNQIKYIERNALINLENLKNLYLDGNMLSEFSSESLMNNAKELETLHLQNNAFTSISRNMFKIFTKLRVLNLSHNKIFSIMSYTFEDLLQLESLNLAHNIIYELKTDMFPNNGFLILSKLNIAYNRLPDLPLSVLDKLQEVKFISIGGNPWHCLCLDLIQVWINKNNIKQVCDDEYLKGIRPICVLDQSGADTCTFTDQSLYHKYIAENNRLPKNSTCTDI